jgi:hypothetical protein
MPFNAPDLAALTSANGFTLWHYRTDDDRATVLAPGYFAPAAPRLLAGDIVIVQAADATALVPIRGGTVAGDGVTVDGSGAAPALLRSATLLADVTLAAVATARSIALDALPGIVFEQTPIAAAATVVGPILQVTFALRDADGADVAPPQVVPVAAGRAAATFATPPVGSGYRVSAVDATDPALFALSPPFVVAPAPRLLAENDGRLLLENGAALLL